MGLRGCARCLRYAGLLLAAACAAAPAAPAVPADYAGRQPPSANFLAEPAALAAGQKLYHANCATCHGDAGRGDGPAGHARDLKPADLTDPRGVAGRPLDYWFWRVSEGGTVEPFHSRGSVMPAWKYQLTEAERWQAIAYVLSLSAGEVK